MIPISPSRRWHAFALAIFVATAAAAAATPHRPQAGAASDAKATAPQGRAVERDRRAADALGWRLSTQAWTFRDRTAFEVIDVAARLGLDWIEFFPGQSLRPDARDVKLGPDMPATELAAFRAKLKEAGVRAGGFGVVGFNNDEASGRRLFAFAKALEIENLATEPEPDALDLLEKLADEYDLKIAFHNHPNPSRYWKPEVVLEAVKGRSLRLGSCSDTGHWTRSGLKPVDCLKQLEGRVLELHFKDLEAFGKNEARDIPWGTGKSDAVGILRELKRQGFRGLIHVEYEDGEGAVLEANVAKCIAFFDATARQLQEAKSE
ncbi:MAG: sugar phosphate isomerase/epimerase [Planctomycetes bacterium]|nr:sugar phosphate isomerase/epimerase [Planctomycetota bacterium]